MATNSTPFSPWLEAIGPINIRFLKSIQIFATTFGPILIGCIPRINRLWGGVFATKTQSNKSARPICLLVSRRPRKQDTRVWPGRIGIEVVEDLNLVIDNTSLPLDNEAQVRVKAYVNNSQRYLERKLGMSVLLGPFATKLNICWSPLTRLFLMEKNLA